MLEAPLLAVPPMTLWVAWVLGAALGLGAGSTVVIAIQLRGDAAGIFAGGIIWWFATLAQWVFLKRHLQGRVTVPVLIVNSLGLLIIMPIAWGAFWAIPTLLVRQMHSWAAVGNPIDLVFALVMLLMVTLLPSVLAGGIMSFAHFDWLENVLWKRGRWDFDFWLREVWKGTASASVAVFAAQLSVAGSRLVANAWLGMLVAALFGGYIWSRGARTRLPRVSPSGKSGVWLITGAAASFAGWASTCAGLALAGTGGYGYVITACVARMLIEVRTGLVLIRFIQDIPAEADRLAAAREARERKLRKAQYKIVPLRRVTGEVEPGDTNYYTLSCGHRARTHKRAYGESLPARWPCGKCSQSIQDRDVRQRSQWKNEWA